MEKDVQEMMEFFASDECNIYELQIAFDDPEEANTLKKMFPEPMFTMLKIIIKQTIAMLEFHNGKNSEPHDTITDSIRELKEAFKNHRHELGKTYGSKPEQEG